jgi:hypothetical protein
LRHGNVTDEERWNDRGNQRESDWRSPFSGRVAATSAHVDRSRDDPAWCEDIEHRSIPSVVLQEIRHNLRRQVLNFLSSAASNFYCLASYDWSQVLLPTWKVTFSHELFN